MANQQGQPGESGSGTPDFGNENLPLGGSRVFGPHFGNGEGGWNGGCFLTVQLPEAA